jgi:hypothetical protein
MNKKITISIIIIILAGVLFFIGRQLEIFNFEQKNDNEEQQDVDNNDDVDTYQDVFGEVVVEGYFSVPEDVTVSFGEIIDQPDQIGDYEENVKNKEALLVMEYEDENDQIKEAYAKSLELNNENISYILRHYTNYFEVGNLSQTQYSFKFSVDKDKKEEYLRETNSGTIVISDDKILVIMSNEDSIEPFMQIFREYNDVSSTFFEYLENNPEVLQEIDNTVAELNQKTQQAQEKISTELEAFANNFWSAWISLDTVELPQYYASNVWFYAGDEWFEEWEMEDQIKDKVHEFVSVGQEMLLDGYVELKEEDFLEDFEEAKKATDTLTLYPVDDFMDLCYSENKTAFFNDFGIVDGDVIMTVRLDSGDNCTVEGNFLAGEIRLFVIRDVAGSYKVVTDFTE